MYIIGDFLKNLALFRVFAWFKELVLGKLFRGILKTVGILVIAVAVLFVVYFWNLDQKLLGWAYKQVNLIFDQKKVDQVF
jgi:hypothetical protein